MAFFNLVKVAKEVAGEAGVTKTGQFSRKSYSEILAYRNEIFFFVFLHMENISGRGLRLGLVRWAEPRWRWGNDV
jgi:hypothetical protein